MSDPKDVSRSNERLIKLSPFYHSAINAVTEPNRTVFCSRYLVERWSPLLGGTGVQILLYLRSHCFHDRRTGECRNHWQVSRAEIGRSIGVSEATVKRELLKNAVLRLFVQPQQEYNLSGGRGGIRRDANSYRVAMDDPIHESDWPRVEAYVQEAEKLKEKGGGDPLDDAEYAKTRARQKNPAASQMRRDYAFQSSDLASGQNDPTLSGAPCRVKMTRQRSQNDPTESGRDSKQTQESTLNVGEEPTFVVTSELTAHSASVHGTVPSKRTQLLDQQVEAFVTELRDFGSERRHFQLLEICQERNLDALPKQALTATRKRLAAENTRGTLGNPGAYYQRVLLSLLEDHQVFVPKLGEPTAEEVHQLAMQSLNKPFRQKKIAQGPSESDNFVADHFDCNGVGQDNVDRALALDDVLPNGKLSVTGSVSFSAKSPTWEELAVPEKSVWQMRARQLFVENGVAEPSDRAVLHQARALREKELREKYEEKVEL